MRVNLDAGRTLPLPSEEATPHSRILAALTAPGATPECKTGWIVLAEPLVAHLTFEKCCPAERIDFWRPLPRVWRGATASGGGYTWRPFDHFGV